MKLKFTQIMAGCLFLGLTFIYPFENLSWRRIREGEESNKAVFIATDFLLEQQKIGAIKSKIGLNSEERKRFQQLYKKGLDKLSLEETEEFINLAERNPQFLWQEADMQKIAYGWGYGDEESQKIIRAIYREETEQRIVKEWYIDLPLVKIVYQDAQDNLYTDISYLPEELQQTLRKNRFLAFRSYSKRALVILDPRSHKITELKGRSVPKQIFVLDPQTEMEQSFLMEIEEGIRELTYLNFLGILEAKFVVNGIDFAQDKPVIYGTFIRTKKGREEFYPFLRTADILWPVGQPENLEEKLKLLGLIKNSEEFIKFMSEAGKKFGKQLRITHDAQIFHLQLLPTQVLPFGEVVDAAEAVFTADIEQFKKDLPEGIRNWLPQNLEYRDISTFIFNFLFNIYNERAQRTFLQAFVKSYLDIRDREAHDIIGQDLRQISPLRILARRNNHNPDELRNQLFILSRPELLVGIHKVNFYDFLQAEFNNLKRGMELKEFLRTKNGLDFLEKVAQDYMKLLAKG